MGKFSFTVDSQGSLATLTGDIDEKSNLDGLLQALKGNNVTLDLGEIRRINSLGMRSWIRMVKALGKKAVVLRRCAPPMVEQLNMLKDFQGTAVVESVLLPYACEACNRATQVELPTVQYRKDRNLPGSTCPSCGQPMTFDDIPERYLAFLSY